MAGFCLVTGLAVIGLGGVIARIFAGRSRRMVLAMMLVLGAVLILLRPTSSHGPSCPLHSGVAQ
jgi:hypothetical protein